WLHHLKFSLADHAARGVVERAVKRNHVGLTQHFLKRRIALTHRLRSAMLGIQDFRPEGARQPGHALTQAATAKNPELRPMQIAYRMAEKAEVVALRPTPGSHVLDIAEQTATQGQNQQHRMLGHGVDRITTYVRHDHAALLARCEI